MNDIVDESGFVFVFEDARRGPEIMLCKLHEGVISYFHWNEKTSEWGAIPCWTNVGPDTLREAQEMALSYDDALPYQKHNPTFKPKS